MIHRRDIQGLRAIAILLVVLAHAGVPGFTGGFIGVDVFFVLSGYLITGLLLREHEATGTLRLSAFYARRLKRLLPALLVMLGAVVVIAGALLTPAELGARSASTGYAATWTSNLYFAFAEIDYFDDLGQRDLFLHTWSLGVEEQFYLVWPLVLLLLLTRRREGGAAESRQRLLRSLVWLLVGGLALYGAGVALDPARAFYMMPARIWQFALGAVVCVALGTDVGERRRWAEWAGWTGLALMLGSAVLLEAVRASGWIVVPSAGAALLIAAGCGQATVTRWASHPVAVWIGDRSYSWYLWHWPVLMLGTSVGVTGSGVAGLVLASLGFASLSYGLIERPLWKGLWTQSLRPRLVILSAVLGMGLFLLVPTRLPERAQVLEARERETYRNCDSWYRSAEVVPCSYGPEDAPKTAVLIGDSIGAQWLGMLRGALQPPEWRAVLLTKSACPIVDEDFVYERIGTVYRVCAAWRKAAIAYLQQLRPHLIVVGSAAVYPFSREQWIGGSSRVLRALTPAAGRVVVIPGTPRLSFHGPQCLEQNRRVVSLGTGIVRSCGEGWKGAPAAETAAYLREAVRPFPNASLLDLNDRVCPSHWCRAQTPDGLVVFRDSAHLTDAFARALAPALAAHLRSPGEVPGPGG